MKLKKITINCAILACSFLFMHCDKKTPNVEPVADVETQSALDAVWATYVISDIDQICAFLGEGQVNQHFYTPVPGSGMMAANHDPDNKFLKIGYNKTLCLDGRVRDGSIFMNYLPHLVDNPRANPNSKYYRDYGFAGRVTLSEYKVDGWLIKLYNDLEPAYIYNNIVNNNYDPGKQQLNWTIAGKFLFVHPTDPNKNIVWAGEITKTLINSTNPKVFAVTKQSAINWAMGKVKYSGECEGFTSTNVPFKMTIDPRTPLVRDFQCFPDKISDISASSKPGVVEMRFEEHHPFVSGIASFTTGTPEAKIYPRQIYFADGENSVVDESKVDEKSTQWPCDNTGQILIKGVSYKVNFQK